MSKLKSLAVAVLAAGALYTAGSLAAPSQAEARHGFHGGGFRSHVFVGGHRFIGGPRYFGVYRYGFHRPWAYRTVLYRPRVVVLPPSPCRVVYRTNVYGYLTPVRICRSYPPVYLR